jgi:hypothetical protein
VVDINTGEDVRHVDTGVKLTLKAAPRARFTTLMPTHVTFVKTGVGQAHTGDVDPATHLIYAYRGDNRGIEVYKPVP